MPGGARLVGEIEALTLPELARRCAWRSEKRGSGSPVTVVGCDPFSTPSAGEWSRAVTRGARDRCSSGPSWGRTDDPVTWWRGGSPPRSRGTCGPPTRQIQIRAQRKGFLSQSLRPPCPSANASASAGAAGGKRHPRPGRTWLCSPAGPFLSHRSWTHLLVPASLGCESVTCWV